MHNLAKLAPRVQRVLISNNLSNKLYHTMRDGAAGGSAIIAVVIEIEREEIGRWKFEMKWHAVIRRDAVWIKRRADQRR